MEDSFHRREMSWKLAIGIFFLPIIFAWFTLRNGYSAIVRSISFSWMILSLISNIGIMTQQSVEPAPTHMASVGQQPTAIGATKLKTSTPDPGQTYLIRLENQKSRVTDKEIAEEDLVTEASLVTESDLISLLSRHYLDGSRLPLNEAQKQERDAYSAWLSDLQKTRFPQMREAYGRILRDRMWQHDIDVQVIGSDKSEIQIIGSALIRNANKQAYLDAMMPSIQRYRFRTVTMRWHKRGEGSAWDIEAPADEAVLVLSDDRWSTIGINP